MSRKWSIRAADNAEWKCDSLRQANNTSCEYTVRRQQTIERKLNCCTYFFVNGKIFSSIFLLFYFYHEHTQSEEAALSS